MKVTKCWGGGYRIGTSSCFFKNMPAVRKFLNRIKPKKKRKRRSY